MMDWHNPQAATRYKPGEELTRPFASVLVHNSGLSKASGSSDIVVLDNACGTGIVSVQLHALLPDDAKARLHLTCADFSSSMIDSVAQRIAENGWEGARAQVADALSLPFPPSTFTHVLTNFGIIGMPNPRQALREQHRVLQPAGTAAFSVWQMTGWYPIVERAIASIPGAPPFPPFAQFSATWASQGGPEERWTEGGFLERVARETGFVDVAVELVPNVTRHRDADAFCTLYGDMLRMVTRGCWSEEQREKMGDLVVPAVVSVLKEEFGDGEASLLWSAWCVTARKPGVS
ncbi:S-adenosyl-L-methionine-dependent methyltransferase [Phyllosticta citrichinensis]|uniref:S-adenosyl-L-methionine-dependent methyltransferase n=1 Tax=Phyllosticta citrichinensis TaxID=1130410 RepID=A0ABR1Y0C5_9PEZI